MRQVAGPVVLPGSRWLFLFLAIVGFLAALSIRPTPVLGSLSTLSDADNGKAVVVTGSVRWAEGNRLQLCSGKSCASVFGKGSFDPSLKGRWVAVEGVWRDGAVSIGSAGSVDVLS